MNYSNEQLLTFKLLIAEYCKDRISQETRYGYPNSIKFSWIDKDNRPDDWLDVDDNHWAQIVNDVELGFTNEQFDSYHSSFISIVYETGFRRRTNSAPWPQRVVAMQRAGVFEKKG